MANHNLFSHGINKTIGRLLSLGPSTISPNDVEGTNFVNIDLSLNSAPHLTTRYQTMPGQRSLHHHLGEAEMGRTNHKVACEAHTQGTCKVACEAHTQGTCNGHPIINVFNYSINLNFPDNNNPPHQWNNTLSATSLGMEGVPLAPPSNQKPVLETNSRISDISHLTEGHSQYAFLSGTAKRSQTFGTDVPKSHPEISTIGLGQGKPNQNTDDQSNFNLGLFHIFSKHFPDHNNPFLPSSTVSPPRRRGVTFDGRNYENHEEEIPQKRNMLSHLKSGPVPGQGNHQVSNPNSENGFVLLSNCNALSRSPQNNITTEPEGNLEQAIQLNHGVESQPRARRQQNSAQRHKSKPYTRCGPYICPHCNVVFDNRFAFSAHAQTHYKNEFPDERMKRREGKTRKRAMCIAQSTSGMTIVPESLQLGNRLTVPSNNYDDKVSKTKQGEGFSHLRVKQEVKEEQVN